MLALAFEFAAVVSSDPDAIFSIDDLANGREGFAEDLSITGLLWSTELSLFKLGGFTIESIPPIIDTFFESPGGFRFVFATSSIFVDECFSFLLEFSLVIFCNGTARC